MSVMAFPIGIVDHSTNDGCIFTLTRPKDRETLVSGTQVTLWNAIQVEGKPVVVRFRGQVTEVSQTTAAMLITHADTNPRWPNQIDPMGSGMPVYLASPNSYHVDMSRICESPEEMQFLTDMARDHQEQTGIPNASLVYIPATQPPDDPQGGPAWQAE